MNAREGIKTLTPFVAVIKRHRRLKTMNAREGIKTIRRSEEYSPKERLKTMNAREGIKTKFFPIHFHFNLR